MTDSVMADAHSPISPKRSPITAQAFRDRLSAAFANAMTGQHHPGLISERVQFLTAATLGIWLAARIDPASAAQAADATAACARNWQQAPDGPGNRS